MEENYNYLIHKVLYNINLFILFNENATGYDRRLSILIKQKWKKRKKSQLDKQEKYRIIKYYESIETTGRGAKQKTVDKFNLARITSLNTILSQSDEICAKYESNESNSKRKRLTKASYEEIDNHLFDMFKLVRQQKGEMNFHDLATQAEEIRDKLLLNPDLTDAQRDKLLSFKASNGFVQSFNFRHNIQLRGEAVDNWKIVLKNMIGDIPPDCIASAEETSIYWKSTHGKSFVTGEEHIDKQLRGEKRPKDQMTVLVSAFMSGEKMPLLVIGKYAKPRCFGKNPRLPCMYRVQESAWMEASIFDEYMINQNKKLAEQNKKIHMFIDSAPAHPISYNLSNMTMKFFPSNNTAKCQPGLINCLKSNYEKILIQKRVEAIKENIKFQVTVLDALHYLEQAWEAVSEQTIRDFFRKAGFVHENLDYTTDEGSIDGEKGPSDDEPIKEEEHGDDDLRICTAYVAKINNDKDCEKYEESESETDKNLSVTSEEAYSSFCTLKRYLAQNDSKRFDLIYEIEDELHRTMMNAKNKSRVNDFFKYNN